MHLLMPWVEAELAYGVEGNPILSSSHRGSGRGSFLRARFYRGRPDRLDLPLRFRYGTFWSMLHGLAEERPDWCAELAGRWLDRQVAIAVAASDDPGSPESCLTIRPG